MKHLPLTGLAGMALFYCLAASAQDGGRPEGKGPRPDRARPEGGADRDARRDALCKKFDTDGDGTLNEAEREVARAAMKERMGEGRDGPPRPSKEMLLKRFDADGDGELSEAEREAARAAMKERMGEGRDGPPRPSKEMLLKRFDADGDGELSEAEREEARMAFQKHRGPRGPRPEGEGPPPGPGGERRPPPVDF